MNILSLDGGGSWAILEAMALGELYMYDTPGQTILGKFDLAAANSGGSIVLACLVLNYTPQMIIDRLNDEKKRKTIFVRNLLSFTGIERYDTAAKLQGLRNMFGAGGDQYLNKIAPPCKLLFSTFNYDRLREEFFRSDPASPAAGAKNAAQPTLSEAVHASTNAPIKYFDAPAQLLSPPFMGFRYWDGAIGGFNNPVMAAVMEMLAYDNPASSLQVLSIGTANVFLPMPPQPWPVPGTYGQNNLFVQIHESGLAHDTLTMATTIIDDPPDQASFQAHLLTSGGGALSQDPTAPVTNGKVVRLNPWIQPVKSGSNWVVPPLLKYAPTGSNVASDYDTDAEAFDALVNLDMDAVEQSEVDLIRTLGAAWIAGDVPNQSIRATGDMQTLIGHKTFAVAVAQAKALKLAP